MGTPLWKALLLEYRLPYRYSRFVFEKLYKLTGKSIVFCRKGKRKILKFKSFRGARDCILIEVIYNKVYWPKINTYIDFEIKKNDTIIDVGANIGFFSVYAANLSKNGKVYCFEPNKRNFERLKEHKKINKLKNMILINKAVSNKNGKVKLYIADFFGGHNTSGLVKSKGYELVDCVSLKNIFDQFKIKKCDFLKIDCEGAEYQMLKSLPKDYFLRIEKIALEYHANGDPLELAKLLYSQGYRISIYKYPLRIGMIFAFKDYIKK